MNPALPFQWDDGLPSPCISICRFKNSKERVCVGCGRTQKQIRNWAKYDVEMREKIMEYLKETHIWVTGNIE
jgi:predicted Fe-S protein YdhL (DUF1289 family)